MSNPAHPTSHALAFVTAAAVAFLGSAVLLRAGHALAPVAGGVPGGVGQPGFLLLVMVILLVAVGVLLVAMAGKEFLDLRRRPRVR